LKTRTMVRHARIQPPTLKITIARYQTFVSADHFKALHLQNMRFRGLDRHNMQIVGTRTITCHGPFVFLLASQNGKIDFEKSAVQRVQPKCLCSKTAFKWLFWYDPIPHGRTTRGQLAPHLEVDVKIKSWKLYYQGGGHRSTRIMEVEEILEEETCGK
jgi:hypothetical protein